MNVPRRAALTLFAAKYSLDADRIAIILVEKNLAHDRVLVDMSNPPEDLLDVNPQLHLPAFVSREVSLYYPEVVLEYLDERFPHPPMLPADPINRSRFRLMLKRITNEWYPIIEKMIAKGELDKKGAKSINEALITTNPLFEGKAFFQSNDFNAVDCTLVPIFHWLREFDVALPAKAEAIQEYAARILARGSVRYVLESMSR